MGELPPSRRAMARGEHGTAWVAAQRGRDEGRSALAGPLKWALGFLGLKPR
jgi:hypothetical protein